MPLASSGSSGRGVVVRVSLARGCSPPLYARAYPWTWGVGGPSSLPQFHPPPTLDRRATTGDGSTTPAPCRLSAAYRRTLSASRPSCQPLPRGFPLGSLSARHDSLCPPNKAGENASHQNVRRRRVPRPLASSGRLAPSRSVALPLGRSREGDSRPGCQVLSSKCLG